MGSGPVPRDTDKMIRQLSLVAYLMSRRGRKVDARTIWWEVEGYGGEDQAFEAFARRFYADRAELAELGIEIETEPNEMGDGDVYWLPRDNFFLPAVRFTGGELAALHTCLCLLDQQFAYSRLLRLALQSLALGSGNTLEDPVSGCISVNLLSSGFDATIAARQARIETAISKRKTIKFKYRSLGKDGPEERRVDPYGLIMTGGNWYLVGHSYERDDVRVFKLRRIEGRIGNLTSAEHDFTRPHDFDLKHYAELEPWQLGAITGSARVRISPRMAWWADINLGHGGDVSINDDGSATLSTDYADGSQLVSLVLGLLDDAMLEQPEELRADLIGSLAAVEASHDGSPPEIAAAARRPAGGSPDKSGAAGDDSVDDKQPQVEPERFPLLAQTITYLIDKLGDNEEATLSAADVCGDLGFDRRALENSMDLLRIVNTGAGGSYLLEAYVKGEKLQVIAHPEGDLMRRPVRLSPREARAMLLAIDLVGSQVLAGRYGSLETAREKIIAAAGGLEGHEPIPVDAASAQDFSICRAINQGLEKRQLVEIEFLSKEGSEAEKRVIEPYLLHRTKGQWYLIAWCRKRDDERTFRLEMIKSARLLSDTFEPREMDLDRHLKDPQTPSGKEAPNAATVWFDPEVARLVLERDPAATLLADGSLTMAIPYFTKSWIIAEILKYRGEAIVIAPEELRRDIAAMARQLASRYN